MSGDQAELPGPRGGLGAVVGAELAQQVAYVLFDRVQRHKQFAGRSNQRIAHELVVALDTVKKHVTHVLGKLGAANRTEAAARARQLGLIP